MISVFAYIKSIILYYKWIHVVPFRIMLGYFKILFFLIAVL